MTFPSQAVPLVGARPVVPDLNTGRRILSAEKAVVMPRKQPRRAGFLLFALLLAVAGRAPAGRMRTRHSPRCFQGLVQVSLGNTRFRAFGVVRQHILSHDFYTDSRGDGDLGPLLVRGGIAVGL